MLELHSESCFTDTSSAKELSFYQQETTIHKHSEQLSEKQVACADSMEGWKQTEQEYLGRARTKPRDSVPLGMPYDKRIIKGSSQLLGGYFEPVLFSNKMH
jgi:hypothetical protein